MTSHASRAGVIGVDHPRSGIDSGVANWRRLESSPTVLGITGAERTRSTGVRIAGTTVGPRNTIEPG